MNEPHDAPATAGHDDRNDPGPVLDSVTLKRLMAEVRNEEPSEPHAYNRMHNRHNR